MPNPPTEPEHNRVGVRVICAVCGDQKAPHGRSAPMGIPYCDKSRCDGYDRDPQVGCLWPGESCEDFGYHHCHNGTEVKAHV